MAKQLVVPGHTLLFEGAPFQWSNVYESWARMPGRGTAGTGVGRCSCGAVSESLPSGVARQRWHRDHKLQVQLDAFHFERGAEQFR